MTILSFVRACGACSRAPPFRVVAEADGVSQALSKVNPCAPDLIITDLRLGLDCGHEF